MRTICTVALVVTFAASFASTSNAGVREKAMNAEQRSICLGRFLVDVPKDAHIVASSSKYRWDSVSVAPRVSREEFAKFISDKEKSLRAVKHEKEASLLKYLNKSHDGASAVLVFWKTPETAYVYETEAYKWLKGYQFQIKGDSSDDKVPVAIDMANRSLSELQYRPSREIPTSPGFCVDHGVFVGEPSRPHLEEAFIHLRFKKNPDVMVTIATATNGDKLNEGLLARTEKRFFPDAYQELVKRVRSLRRGQHPVGNIQGEETLDSVPGGETHNIHMFYWESTGKPHDIYAPGIVVNLETGETLNSEKRRPSLTDQQAIELFDSIVNSIRVRPTIRPGD